MHIPVNHQTSLLGDHFTVGDQNFHEDEVELSHHHHGQPMAESSSGGEGSPDGDGDGSGSPSPGNNGGCIRDRPVKVIPCPRCQSMNTKFCYYNNYSVNQPRHFCRNCQRYWTVGGTLRNVPVGGGSRKKTRTRNRNDAHPYGAETSPSGDVLASSCMQQLSMLPPSLGFAAPSQLPFLQFTGGLSFPSLKSDHRPLAGLQEVPDLQSLYEVPQVPQFMNSSPMLPNGFFLNPELGASVNNPSDALASVMAKAGLWSSAPGVQQLHALTGGSSPHWEDRPLKSTNSWYSETSDRKNLLNSSSTQPNATVLPQSWSSKQATFWDTSLLQQQQIQPQRSHHDRLVPHTSWDRNVSPNGSNITSELDDRCLPSNCFSQAGYGREDHTVVSQPWVGLQASDILFQ